MSVKQLTFHNMSCDLPKTNLDDYQTMVTPLGNQYLQNEPSYAPRGGREVIYLEYPHFSRQLVQTPTSESHQNMNMESGDYTKVWEGAPTHAWAGAKEFASKAYV